MKLTKEEALEYLDRLIVAQEIIEEVHQVGDEFYDTARSYDWDKHDGQIFVLGLEQLAEVAGYELTVNDDWPLPDFVRISFEHGGRTFSDLMSRSRA